MPEIPENMTPEQEDALLQESIKKVQNYVPAMFMGVNTAQYRALQEMFDFDKFQNRIPDFCSVEFANGGGKSTLLIVIMVGISMGKDFLNPAPGMYPQSFLDFCDSLADKRDQGKLSLRIVCTSADMEADGSIYELLKNVFPWAKMDKADHNGCYRKIEVQHPYYSNIRNFFAIKTFDQSKTQHTGSTCDWIGINEPLPEKLIGETIARIRGGGVIHMFATILDEAKYLENLEESDKIIVRRTKGHLYENCIGEEVTEEMADEVFREIGVTLEKNKAGEGYITNGVLKKEKIDAMIDGWLRMCPDEVEARKTGRPLSSGGRIYPTFSKEVHMVPDEYFYTLPETCPIVMICDPHPARPDAVAWATVTPADRLLVIKEWPDFFNFGHYDQIKEKRFTITQKTEMWRNIELENGFSERIVARIGDPNRFKEPDASSLQSLLDLYTEKGYEFNIEIPDSLEVGHEIVNQYLYFDQIFRRQNPNDPAGQPHLLICESCKNTQRALQFYKRQSYRDRTKPVKESVEERFKDFCDLIRYLCVWHTNNNFDMLKREAADGCDDYDKFLNGSIPSRFREKKAEINLHGRQLLRSKE